MRISHKRKIQSKLNKRNKATLSAVVVTAAQEAPKKKPVAKAAPKAEVKAAPKAAAVQVEAKAVVADINLTPKQQQVLDIVQANPEGINPKGIGLAAGQEDGKAAAWATSALKKLAEEGLVERVQLAGNKVSYKPAA
ncbi:hypothetical protein VST7929_01269 [Vibrio stylophorae]|uniref:MarR family transcriptional regulator n=1 Tax=Vibrio stylophorae TaxID=659351 RepID=A0ABM8ZSX4_9VIBR|nr:MarR family transcriptional regulator [Vibrio stylophorae]CAH0533403.1 hypothetical protein VST7929_01269 [Vibrio stylophorae]